MSEKIITGTIKIDGETVVFVCEGFRFTFVRTGDDVNSFTAPISISVDSNGYVWGVTYDERAIAIHTKYDFKINHTRILNVYNYILFKRLVNNKDALFRGIYFINGGIKTINPCRSLKRDTERERQLYKEEDSLFFVFKAQTDIKTIDIELNGEHAIWRFGNQIDSRISVDDGTSLKDGISILEVLFDNEKSLMTLYDYYAYVKTIVSFMTYRANVEFESVKLIELTEDGISYEVAESFIRTDGIVSTRRFMNSISVYSISEDSIRQMVYNAAQIDKKHKSLPIGFLPENDADFGVLTKNRVRDICSALEVEMDLAKIKASKGAELEELIEEVKNKVKEYEKNENTKIPENTYKNIFNSIGNWGDSVADRVNKAWDMYEQDIMPLEKYYKIDFNNDKMHECIAKFVSVRNRITHKGFNELDDDLAGTAIVLSALVYCMAMSRLGIEEEKIKDFMARRIIG